nr:MAG TPA: hypothetical protein [Caudoviricetes sp.]
MQRYGNVVAIRAYYLLLVIELNRCRQGDNEVALFDVRRNFVPISNAVIRIIPAP